MRLLVTIGHPTLLRYPSANLGRLVQPRHFSSIQTTAEAGIPWAADNDAFGAFDVRAFERMLDVLEGLPGCLFVAAPDVVGDWEATLALWDRWLPEIVGRGLPPALVAQDGLTSLAVPWEELDALFVGGAPNRSPRYTRPGPGSGPEWKLSVAAEGLAREARARGKHSHLGRVNSMRRLIYAASNGYDSVDGSRWARFRDHWLPLGLDVIEHGRQLRLEP